MGFFSWVTSDTNRSVSNVYSDRGTFPVYLLQPQGKPIFEEEYEGYGEFGGYDIFELVAKWNDEGLYDKDDREVGIEIAHNDELNFALKYPIKIVEHPMPYELASPSKTCPDQGFFYDEE